MQIFVAGRADATQEATHTTHFESALYKKPVLHLPLREIPYAPSIFCISAPPSPSYFPPFFRNLSHRGSAVARSQRENPPLQRTIGPRHTKYAITTPLQHVPVPQKDFRKRSSFVFCDNVLNWQLPSTLPPSSFPSPPLPFLLLSPLWQCFDLHTKWHGGTQPQIQRLIFVENLLTASTFFGPSSPTPPLPLPPTPPHPTYDAFYSMKTF